MVLNETNHSYFGARSSKFVVDWEGYNAISQPSDAQQLSAALYLIYLDQHER